MEADETVENMFSRFQTLVVGLNVLDKCYTIIYHMKNIIISLLIK